MKLFITGMLFAFSATSLLASEKSTSKPNIIIIMADDLGYSDFSCYGNTMVQTPRIDSLAKDGIRFTDAHTTSGVCTPSRYSLLTGRYCWKTFLKSEVVANGPALIRPKDTTLASMLKQVGYQTSFYGKWHLGFTDKAEVDYNVQPVRPGANEVGFDYSYLMPVGHFYAPLVYLENGYVVNYDPKDPITIDGNSQQGGKAATYKPEDVTPHLTQKVLTYIEENQEKPFFIHYSTPNVHSPITPSAAFKGSAAGAYGDYLMELDWSVGQIIDQLKKLGLEKNTMIIVTSDNGGAPKFNPAYNSNAPLLGDKGDLAEGGHRIPFIVHWPEQAPAGVVSEQFLLFTDVLRTFASLVAYDCKPNEGEDGVDLLAAFKGEKDLYQDRAVVIQSRAGMWGLRQGDWMYLHGEGPGDHRKSREKYDLPHIALENVQLYHLKEDLSQTNNLAKQHPEKIKAMQKIMVEMIGDHAIPAKKRKKP